MNKFYTLVASTLLVFATGCGDGGNRVIESASDPDAMAITPGANNLDMEASSKAMEDSMNPNVQ